MAKGGFAAMINELADDEVQLQIGSGLFGPAADEAASLGKIGGQHSAALRRHQPEWHTLR